MSAKTATPKQPKTTEPRTSIFVSRVVLSECMTLRPPTDEQRRILMHAIVYKWPKVFELKASDEVKSALEGMRVAWTDKK